MEQLSPEDASLLYAETPQARHNVSLLHIYDQSTAPGGLVRFKTILQHIESRLGASPVFRRRLQRVPMSLDHPYWVDDEHFDLEYHVRHIALPKPGDWRQFCIQVSRIHARALDLDRPLWELYVIEGLDAFIDLPPGSFAVLTKTHQAAIAHDGGSELTALLHDLSPDAGPAPPPSPWFPRQAPGSLALLKRGVVRTITAPLRMARPVARALGQAAPAALAWAAQALDDAPAPVATRFNAAVSAWRVFETRRFDSAEVQRMTTLVEGATVDDVVLALCGGALRRYLDGHGELPAQNLCALAPAGPQAWRRIELATTEPDPLQRLAAIVAQTGAARAPAPGAGELDALARQAPAVTLALAGRWLGLTLQREGQHAPLAHCTVTHVAGPEQPLYLCGARLTYLSAMLPVSDGMGLVFAVTSYDGRLIVSPTSCRELMPDPEVFAQCLRDSYEELRALRQVAPARPRRPSGARPAAARLGARASRRGVAG